MKAKKSVKNVQTKSAKIKIPFCDMYIVKGSELRKDEESKKIGDKIMAKIVRENHFLRKRLAHGNNGLVKEDG